VFCCSRAFSTPRLYSTVVEAYLKAGQGGQGGERRGKETRSRITRPSNTTADYASKNTGGEELLVHVLDDAIRKGRDSNLTVDMAQGGGHSFAAEYSSQARAEPEAHVQGQLQGEPMCTR
jgi:hypothetical protein